MIKKKMSKDIAKMESKIFFGFTPRQLICVTIGIILEYINIKTLKNEFVGITIAALCFAEGWIKMGPERTPFFKYMLKIGRFSFSQKERVWSTTVTKQELKKMLKEYKESEIMDEILWDFLYSIKFRETLQSGIKINEVLTKDGKIYVKRRSDILSMVCDSIENMQIDEIKRAIDEYSE